MKSSTYHEVYGLAGILRGLSSNTELHFDFEKGKTRTPIEIIIQGQVIPAYLEIIPMRITDAEEERDLGLRLVMGNLPVGDLQPKPEVVGGNTGAVNTPEPFTPVASPETDNSTFSTKEPAQNVPVEDPKFARFVPVDGPETSNFPALNTGKMTETSKVKEEKPKKEKTKA